VTKLAQALVPLMLVEAASAAIQDYPQRFSRAYVARMAAKFGLAPGGDTVSLILDALNLLAANRVDYTIFFRRLGDFDSAPGAANAAVRDIFLDRAAFDAWAQRYAAALQQAGYATDPGYGAKIRSILQGDTLQSVLGQLKL